MNDKQEQPVSMEPVYAFRRKGQDSFCTCDVERYEELSLKPNLFEMRLFYTAAQLAQARQQGADEERKKWAKYLLDNFGLEIE